MYAVKLNLHEVALIALRMYEDAANRELPEYDMDGCHYTGSAALTDTDCAVLELCKEHGFKWDEVTEEMNRIAAQTCDGCGVYGVPLYGGCCGDCQELYGRRMSGN